MSNDEWLLGEMNVYADSLPAPTGLVANIGAENEVTVSWNDMSSGEGYIEYSVQVSRFSDFRDVSDYGSPAIVDSFMESDNTFWMILDKGSYYIRVRAIDYTGEYGEWSTVITVDVPIAWMTGYEGTILGVEGMDDRLDTSNTRISEVTVNRNGYLSVQDGGKTRGIIVNSGGQMRLGDDWAVYTETYAIETVINDGGRMMVKGGYAQHTVINTGGEQTVYGVFSSFTFMEDWVGAYDTTVNGGTQTAIAASISRTTVNSGGLMVLHGGLVDSLTVNSGGIAKIYSYQAGKTATTDSTRFEITYFAGRAADMAINGGTAYLYDGTTADDTRIGSGGVMMVHAGAEAFDTTISTDGSLMVLAGGRATDSVLNGGSIHVATGGLIDGVSINSGKLYLYGGAILDGMVNVNGTVMLDDVTMNRGTLNLQLTSASAVSPMINDLSYLEGGELTVTVDAAPGAGIYVLAGNAGQYSQSISLKADSGTLGALTVNGDALNYGAYRYQLLLSDNSDLTLQISSSIVLAKPEYSVSTTEPTNQDVEIIAAFSADAVIREYSFDGQNWSVYQGKIILSGNGSVYFREGDGSGNYGPVASCIVNNIDKIAPEKPQLTASTQEPTYDAVLVTALFSADSVKREYSLDGRSWQTYTNPVAVTGNGTVYFRGTDAAGNTGVAQYEVSNILTVSPEAPSTVSLARSSYKKYNITLKWDKATTADKSIKIANYEISINGVIYTSKSTSFSLKNVDLGSYECMVRAIDSNGNVGKWSDVTTFTAVDETAPVVKITSVSVNGYDLILGWNGEDKKGDIISYSVKYDGIIREMLGGDASSMTLTLSENDVGKHKVEVIAFDGTNYSKAASKTVAVKDVTPPEQVTGLSVPVADSKYKAILSWHIGTDNSGKVARYEILLDNGKILKSTRTALSVSKLAVGEHTYQVRALDQAKNAGAWSEVQTFIVRDMTAPTSIKGKATVTGYSVGFELSGKDNSGEIAKYIVSCGDKVVETTSSSAVLDGFDPGKHSAVVVAYDAEGNASKAAKVTFTVKDVTVPEQVIGLSSSNVQDKNYKANLSWQVAFDNSGKIAQYEILLDGKFYHSSKPTLTTAKLTVGEHSYQVRAIDQTKNVGAWSEVQTFIVNDVTAPNKVSAKAKVTDNWVGIEWKEAKDNVGVTAYEVWFGESKDCMSLGYQLEANQFSCDFSGIDKGTWYYGVVAIDAAGNRSTLTTSKLTVKQELETAVPVELSVFPFQNDEQYSSGLLNLAAGF